MISCMIINSFKALKMNHKDLTEGLFHGDHLEINQYENGMVFIFIYDVEKVKVWQAVLNLEVDQIPVGFGFGIQKEEARDEALARLKIVTEMNSY